MLITLVIIGIIAALTIPNLLQKYQEQATVKKVQKFYSNLSNAYSLAAKDNGPVSDWELTDDVIGTEKVYEILFKPYFKISKDCKGTNTGDCSAVTYTNLNNTVRYHYGALTNHYKLVLNDGASVFFRSYPTNVSVFYDVNGVKGPNTWGRDLFEMAIVNKKVSPTGAPDNAGYGFQSYCNTTTSDTKAGLYCAGWVIYKGNMDYLHCDDLSWTGKSKCK